MRILTTLLIVAGLFVPTISWAQTAKEAVLWKTPGCMCCEGYADYLRRNGFKVTVKATHDLSWLKRKHAVPANLEGCHTMMIGGYVVEGHVPLKSLNRLLTERPNVKGISLPGMPNGSPGMGGFKSGPFKIYSFTDSGTKLFATE